MNNMDVENLLKDYQGLHSDFQIENFVIGNEGDKWAQYKQCLREIKARIGDAESEEAKLRYLETKNKMPWLKRLLHRKVIANGNNLTGLKNKRKEKKREFDCLVKIAKQLKAQIGEVTDERRQQLELESWTAKGLKLAAIDILSSRTISNQTYEFIFSLPKDSQVRILKTLARHPPMEVHGFSREEIKQISPPRKEKTLG
jgi:hypothetical protein